MIEWWFGPGVKTIFTWLCFLQKRHRRQSSLLPAAESSRYFHVPIWMLVDGVQGSGSTATRFNTSHFIVQTPITIMIFSRNLTGNRHDVNSSSLPIWSAPINIKLPVKTLILGVYYTKFFPDQPKTFIVIFWCSAWKRDWWKDLFSEHPTPTNCRCKFSMGRGVLEIIMWLWIRFSPGESKETRKNGER